MIDPIKEKEHAERIESFKVAARDLRTARDNVRSSEQRLKDAENALKNDMATLDGAHVSFVRQAEQLGFKHPGGSGSLAFLENLLSITGAPAWFQAAAPSYNVNTAIGMQLDAIGRVHKCPRTHNESDEVYRERVKAAIPPVPALNPDGSARF